MSVKMDRKLVVLFKGQILVGDVVAEPHQPCTAPPREELGK